MICLIHTLNQINSNQIGAQLYLTGDDDPGATAACFAAAAPTEAERRIRSALRRGRPDVRAALEGAAGCDGRNAYVMACGPPSLLLSASEAAMALGCQFHQETFQF